MNPKLLKATQYGQSGEDGSEDISWKKCLTGQLACPEMRSLDDRSNQADPSL